ncbi:carboxylating nicotinate-nucleotide diphosphorylase [Thermodesulfovibrio sp.]|jgi:nicotinate-nucleotide pyrophosphorylase (carboxylating)|uniref:carboxylating nicotinate-nucleotide diphosphorylase n=1 Tax=Thermodesulfovibrio sp. TaxID=2067987 RepID=UPI00261DB9F8|nr:carboxylating nicotinate-nucleotide diphosphorylase [Thermodesulfovibrio sp.]
MFNPIVDKFFNLAILEDIGNGDITSELLIPEDTFAKAHIICKEDCILAGLPFIKRFFVVLSSYFKLKSDGVDFIDYCNDGDFVKKGEIISELKGNARLLLAGERIALNILQRLSGIATLTSKFVRKTEGYDIKILDTRKTTPCMRFMEKYAVRVGGGFNHRFALYDAVLIKDNHIKITGSVKDAIKLSKKKAIHQKIEIEVKNIEELKEAVLEGADIVMLDNMDMESIKKAVQIAKGKVLLEVSGGVNLENIHEIASTGVDFVSIGALTHSAKAVDISMKIREVL